MVSLAATTRMPVPDGPMIVAVCYRHRLGLPLLHQVDLRRIGGNAAGVMNGHLVAAPYGDLAADDHPRDLEIAVALEANRRARRVEHAGERHLVAIEDQVLAIIGAR